MRRGSVLSPIVLERLAGGQSTDRREPPRWSREGLAGRDIRGLEQSVDASGGNWREHRNRTVVVRDLNRLAVAHAANGRRQAVAKFPYTDLLRHL